LFYTGWGGGGGGGGHGGFKFAVSVLCRDKYFFRGEGAVSGLVFILINRGNERATVDRKGYYKPNKNTSGNEITNVSHLYAFYISHTKYFFNSFALELSGGPLTKKYKFEQFHFHWGANDSEGSEHRVEDKMYPAEVGTKQWNFKSNFEFI